MPKLINPGLRDTTVTWTENGVRRTVTVGPFNSTRPLLEGETREVDIPAKHAAHYLATGILASRPVSAVVPTPVEVVVEEPLPPSTTAHADTATEDDGEDEDSPLSDVTLANREDIAKEETAKLELTDEQKRKLALKAQRLANLAKGRLKRQGAVPTTVDVPKGKVDALVEDSEEEGDDSDDEADPARDQEILAAYRKTDEDDEDLEPSEDVAPPAHTPKRKRFAID